MLGITIYCHPSYYGAQLLFMNI